jgi:dihydroneopterin aldolase
MRTGVTQRHRRGNTRRRARPRTHLDGYAGDAHLPRRAPRALHPCQGTVCMVRTIHVEGLRFLARHGVYDEERLEGRSFEISLRCGVGACVGQRDALETTVDYRDLARVVVEVMEGPPVHLIETLAQQMVERMMHLSEVVLWVAVRIDKHATGVPGNPDRVSYTLEVTRS